MDVPEPSPTALGGSESRTYPWALAAAAAPARTRGRGRLVRRMLLLADVLGLTLAFFLAQVLFGAVGHGDRIAPDYELLLFIGTLPLWVFAARVYSLYDRDEERTDHSGVDEFAGVFHLVTVGSWLVFALAWITGLADPNAVKMLGFWGLAIALVTFGRAAARWLARRKPEYVQKAVIVGAGDIGQLIARKVEQHPEYRIDLAGFVDTNPKQLRSDLEHVPLLGPPEELSNLVDRLDIDRVIIAFSNDSPEETVSLVRQLRHRDLQLDVIPRLFEIVGPNSGIHMLEGMTLVTLPSGRVSRSSHVVKRVIDVVGALIGLIVLAPVFATVAWKVKRGSPGPVFFRQTRLGMGMREFTALKFRTMRVDADHEAHRDYIRKTMDAGESPQAGGLYKLEQRDAITPFGRWLRKTSLDELPQLVNVLRGEMSLVGPRPCIPYEVDHFAPHHFERFLVPAGMTGLWQVTARACATFGEALDMDVAYARSWSVGLDLQLLCRTPLQLFRLKGTR